MAGDPTRGGAANRRPRRGHRLRKARKTPNPHLDVARHRRKGQSDEEHAHPCHVRDSGRPDAAHMAREERQCAPPTQFRVWGVPSHSTNGARNWCLRVVRTLRPRHLPRRSAGLSAAPPAAGCIVQRTNSLTHRVAFRYPQNGSTQGLKWPIRPAYTGGHPSGAFQRGARGAVSMHLRRHFP